MTLKISPATCWDIYKWLIVHIVLLTDGVKRCSQQTKITSFRAQRLKKKEKQTGKVHTRGEKQELSLVEPNNTDKLATKQVSEGCIKRGRSQRDTGEDRYGNQRGGKQKEETQSRERRKTLMKTEPKKNWTEKTNV